ncbi:STAS domain-containing protein [Streptomyces cinereoruber]|uniref:STAS domain-containing protein n=1 Tax=Streptomyces cinereoruber TaxID=67260 RepID=UPI0036525911
MQSARSRYGTDGLSLESTGRAMDMAGKWEGRGQAVVWVTGELDIATAPHIRRILLDAVSTYRQVTVDLARIGFCDCAGLSILIAAQNAARAHGTLLLLRRVSGQMDWLLHRVPHRLHIERDGLPGAPASTPHMGGP